MRRCGLFTCDLDGLNPEIRPSGSLDLWVTGSEVIQERAMEMGLKVLNAKIHPSGREAVAARKR